MANFRQLNFEVYVSLSAVKRYTTHLDIQVTGIHFIDLYSRSYGSRVNGEFAFGKAVR